MYGRKNLLQEEEKRLQAMKIEIEEQLNCAPEGNLRVTIWNNEFDYSKFAWGEEQISEEMLQEAAEKYLKEITIDETNEYELV